MALPGQRQTAGGRARRRHGEQSSRVLGFIFFFFSPGSGRHHQGLRARPGTLWGQIAGWPRCSRGASFGAGVAYGHPSVKPAAKAEKKQTQPCSFSNPQNWKTQTGVPKLGDLSPCEWGAAPSRSCSTAGTAGSRPSIPKSWSPSFLPRLGRKGLRVPRGWPEAQRSPPRCMLRPVSGPVARSPRGRWAKAEEPEPSLVPVHTSPSFPPQG